MAIQNLWWMLHFEEIWYFVGLQEKMIEKSEDCRNFIKDSKKSWIIKNIQDYIMEVINIKKWNNWESTTH